MKTTNVLLAGSLFATSAMAAVVAPAAPTAAPNLVRRQLGADDYTYLSVGLMNFTADLASFSSAFAGLSSKGISNAQLASLGSDGAALATSLSSFINIPLASAQANSAAFISSGNAFDASISSIENAINSVGDSIGSAVASSAVNSAFGSPSASAGAKGNAAASGFGSPVTFVPFAIAAAAAGGAAVVFAM